MARLTWMHHTLIQALLSRGPMKESELHSLFSDVTGKNPVNHQQLFSDFLLKINKELAYVQFELRGCRNQYDGKVYYGVVNNVADEQSKLGTKYSVPQIAFYKAVIEAIVQDVMTQGCITNIEALNTRLEIQSQAGQDTQDSQSRTPAAFRNFSISQKEKTLNDLIQDRWLCSLSDGKIGLGVRSFLDLRSWFRNNDIPSCDVCNEAGVTASTCPNAGCPIRIHDYCLKKKYSQRKVARVCPGCGTEWPLPEGIEEAQEEEAHKGPGQSSSQPPTRKRLRNLKAEAVEVANIQSGPVLRKKLKSCKAEAVEDWEAEEAPASSVTSTDPKRSRRSRRL